MWYVIIEHEDKNVRAELIWRLLIATIKTPIHISQNKFTFHVQRSLKHTIIYTYLSLLMWSIIYKLELEDDDMETVLCAFFLLSLVLYMSGWSDVENDQVERS